MSGLLGCIEWMSGGEKRTGDIVAIQWFDCKASGVHLEDSGVKGLSRLHGRTQGGGGGGGGGSMGSNDLPPRGGTPPLRKSAIG